MDKRLISFECDVEADVILFDRSDPYQVVSVDEDGKRFTRLNEVHEDMDRSGRTCMRRDCAMVNFWPVLHGHRIYAEFADNLPTQAIVYFSPDGTLTGDGVQYLTYEHKLTLEATYRRIRAVSQDFPEMAYFLGEDVTYCKSHDIYNCPYAHA